MKNLSNISPFLLLLFPVFMMLLVTLATGVNNETNTDPVTKKSTNAATFIVKAATAILK